MVSPAQLSFPLLGGGRITPWASGQTPQSNKFFLIPNVQCPPWCMHRPLDHVPHSTYTAKPAWFVCSPWWWDPWGQGSWPTCPSLQSQGQAQCLAHTSTQQRCDQMQEGILLSLSLLKSGIESVSFIGLWELMMIYVTQPSTIAIQQVADILIEAVNSELFTTKNR